MDPLFDITAYLVAAGSCVCGLSTNRDLADAEKKFRDRVNQICLGRNRDRHLFLLEFRDRWRRSPSKNGFEVLEEMASEHGS